MDKVKQVLALAKRHHFWVLFGVVVVLAAVVWFSASSGLADRIETRTGKLESQRKNVSGISSVSIHPNEACLEEIQKEYKKLQNEVFKAWKRLYEDQKAKNQWPSTVGEGFLTVVNALGPDDPIPEPQRADYMYFIEPHFQTLYDIIDIRLPAERDERGNVVEDEDGKPKKIDPLAKATSTTGYGSGEMDYGAREDEYDTSPYGQSTYPGSGTSQKGELVGKVFWNTANIQQLWRRLHWNDVPTDSQVRLAQEDLWVFEALLRIVDQTNEGATSYYNAAVKRIEAIQIGQDVALSLGTGRQGGPFGSGGGYSGSAGYGREGPMLYGPTEEQYSEDEETDYGESDDAGASGASAYGAQPGATAAMSLNDQWRLKLIDHRYVDRDGKPLPVGAEGRVEHPFDQFKMMPVRMVLMMDQRRIPRLLVKCANSTMPVVVRRVRLNPGKGRSFDPGRMTGPRGPGGFGGPSGGGPGYYSGESDYSSDSSYEMDYGSEDTYPGSQYGQYGQPGQAGDRGKQPGSFDLPFEVQGIIYIFNPPNFEKLAGGAAGAEPVMPPAADTVPADGDPGSS